MIKRKKINFPLFTSKQNGNRPIRTKVRHRIVTDVFSKVFFLLEILSKTAITAIKKLKEASDLVFFKEQHFKNSLKQKK